jgi:large subunit ribosomal protein L21e
MHKVGGARRKTRNKLMKDTRDKGKIRIRDFVQKLDLGAKVVLLGEPAYQNGFYHRRFHGRTATVTGKQGDCYKVELRDGGTMKTFIVHPVHLKKSEGQ